MSAPQITLYSHKQGPNGWKIAILLQELGISYTTKFLDFGTKEQKSPEFTKLNPNGRIPAIVDHGNKDFVVWESGAILQYIAEKYDTSGKFYGKTTQERAHVNQWVAYQISGLGPSQGQANWFLHFHSEKLPSAIERYQNESKRIYEVIDKYLAEGNKQYLVGDRFTIADIAFYPWVKVVAYAQVDISVYTHVKQWYDRIEAHDSVKRAYADQK